jgi:type I restriction enzyme S subunit
LFDRTKRTGFEGEQLLSVYRDHGVVPKASRDDNNNRPSDDLSPYQLVCPGDLAINKMKAWQGSVAISEHKGIVSPAYFVYEAKHKESGKYLHYLMRSPQYVAGYLSMSKGIRINQWDLEPQYHSRLPVLIPPKEEQDRIATFLDRETSKVEALIAEQEKLLALLAEKRQATISRAVTRGLNPNAPMKDSGIPWLGEVPVHWHVKRVKRLTVSIEQGWSPQCENYPAEGQDEWGVLKVGCVNGGVFSATENKRLPDELEPIGAYALKRDDLLISRANTRDLVGSAAVVPEDHANLLLCDKLYRLRTDAGICSSRFLAAFLGTPLARSKIEIEATGVSSSMLNIGQSTILELDVSLPPLEEQLLIMRFVADELNQVDELVAEAKKAIRLLTERRSALIAAAVTGKIDVSHAA